MIYSGFLYTWFINSNIAYCNFGIYTPIMLIIYYY